jgi:hypothetical protein
MHQHSNLLNFKPLRLHTLHRGVTSNVLVSVTIGIGDFIHIWNAHARLVSLGFTSCFIVSIYTFCAAKIVIADETTKHFWVKRRSFVTNGTIGTGIFIIFAAENLMI